MLHVHRSRSAEALLAALAGVLAEPRADDPFAPELLAVGAPGTERWVAQRLSHHLGASAAGGDGVCARVDLRAPAAVLDGALAALGEGHAAAVAAWDPEVLPWHVLQVLDDLAAEAGTGPDDPLAVLRHHLRPEEGDGTPRARRVGVAARLAALLARCGADRPALLARWAREPGPAAADLPEDLRWWPPLLARVRERAGTPAPAELLEDACARLRAGAPVPALPARLGVLAVTAPATAHLSLLAALAEHREVHLWLPHPSARLWDAVAQAGGAAGGAAGALREQEDARTGALVRHPLLRSTAREARELQVRLAPLAPGHADTHHEAPAPPPTLLGRLQRALAEDDPAAGRGPLDPRDRSVQVHACHGRTRQVEVLREAVLGLLDADPTLQPRDVLVVCPDVDAFAPVVGAVFATDSHPGAELRVSVAGRSPLQADPLLALAVRLLELAAGRATATDVLDLAAGEPVRARFGFDDEELEQLRTWAVQAGVHWGLGPEHRRAWRLGEVRQGSWRAGLDRVLVGVALGGDLLAGAGDPVAPLADVESSRVDLAGRLAELLDRLEAALARLSGPQPVAGWCDALLESVLDLADTPPGAAWWDAQVRRELGVVRERAAGAGDAPVGLADAAALLTARFTGRAVRVPFRTGALTVCGPGPLRAVPHRVVCLLGLDDDAFPRPVVPDADDPLAREPRVGDHDPRAGDRQAFLDAVLAAGDHLLVLHSGHDVRTGAPLPPAVPVGELLDALDALGEPGAAPVREHVVVHHPLQPTDARNFTAGALGREGAFSFDTTAHAGAVAAAGGARRPGPFLERALPAPPPAPGGVDEVDLDALVRFWQHPARGFLRQRLDVAADTRAEEPDDALPLQLDGLGEWAVGDRCLAARLAGVPAADVARREGARGDLPPGALGAGVLRRVGGAVEQLVAAAGPWTALPARTVEVDLELAGCRLAGAVRGVRALGDGSRAAAVTVTYSRLKARQELRAWVEVLALTLAEPHAPRAAVVVGRGERGSTAVVRLGPVDPGAARAALEDLLALRRAGLSVPLPLPAATGAAWAAAAARGASAQACAQAAAREWTSTHDWPREDADEEHELVWGGRVDVEHLLGWAPPPGAPPGTPAGFAELARRVWRPLLAARHREAG
ncbi:exodeoxyribonuclease V subunit gamma [Kineococcus gypseus]|uniref:exodeoxyribonuclease V subunit gamma n=1 Tax=Kineococcus gypseus TaxID=1637102 RepID=UPI003D7D661C